MTHNENIYAPTYHFGCTHLLEAAGMMKEFFGLVRSEVLKPSRYFKGLRAPTQISGSLKRNGYFERCTHPQPPRSFAFSRRFSSRSIAVRIRSSRSSPSTKAASMRALAPFGRVKLMFSSQSFLRPIRRGISRT